ncbi:lipopolysaccharide biosynthesis protein [Xanthomonas indica]|uniref:Polysaccharide biosynthesis C-terminal domain-containing protein n=1 Tax=Xanthomonas indica TaxID=2912242 RepID=A0AAU8I8X0_9XANT|nr:polysaccharide biosynthesis C-terminal domain-containing protein [Xanthomonas indica]MCI2261522.1 polysaccharide biosynthesis C-terminal domain-containing protein [Xanthomonas indica]
MNWRLPATWRAGTGALSAQWGAILGVAAVSLGLSVWLARSMQPDGFGRYAYLLNLATLLALAQDAGMRTLVLRERVAPSSALAGDAAALPGLARGHLLLATLVLMGTALLLPRGVGDPALVWAVLCFAAVTLSQLVSAQLKGAGQWRREARWQVGARALSGLAIVLAVLLLGARPDVVFAAWAVGLLLAYALLGRDLHDRPRWRPQATVYRAAAGFLWIDLATGLYRRSDIVILHRAVSPAEVGQYAAAYRLFDGVLLLAAPVALLFFRRLRLTRDDPAAAQRLHGRALAAAGVAGAMLAIAGTGLGAWVVGLLYGQAYRPTAGPLVGWLFAAFVFVLPNYVLTQTAIALERQRCYMVGAGLAAATNLALNLWLAPHYGARGAALATIATEAVLAATLWLGLRRAAAPAA